MDATRFDALTRLLSDPVSRRRTIAGLTLGALRLARGDGGVAGPGCKNVGKPCDKDKDCCSGVCKGKKDKDCRPFCGPKAACVLCDECDETQNRACVGVAECNFPPS